MKVGSGTERITRDSGKPSSASIAAEELQLRIKLSGLGEALTRMACDLCLEEVPVEEAFQKIQESAIEKMILMMDTSIIGDDGALKSCLEMVTQESERAAWAALEKGTDELREGLELLEQAKGSEKNGWVN